MGRLKGICISEKRGTEKHEVREAMVKMDWGLKEMRTVENGIVRSVFFLMTRSRHSVQEVQK